MHGTRLVLGPAEGRTRVPGMTAVCFSATDIIRSKGGHIDELIVLGSQLHDLDRSVETDKKRTDDRGTAEFLQHFR
jgi:hypothetical protein